MSSTRKERLKIAFIGGRSFNSVGGIENYMLNLCSYLARQGHQVSYYCESSKDLKEILNGFEIIHQRSIKSKFFNKIWLSLKATIRVIFCEKNTDFIHYNAAGPGLASFIPIIIGMNVIYQSHGLDWYRTKWSPFQRRLLKYLHNIVLSYSMYIIAVSKEQSQYIITHNKKFSKTIPSAVNLPNSKIASDILQRFSLRTGEYFLYLGRLVKDKNPDVLIDSYLQSGIDSKKLVIAGDNMSDPEFVKGLYSRAKVNENIIFTGAVHGADKEKLLKECFAFCIPSTIEGMPISLLEAMSHSKICIVSKIPGCIEALGDNGIWVEPEDINSLSKMLVYSIECYTEIKNQGVMNYKRVKENFTWDKIGRNYELYCFDLL